MPLVRTEFPDDEAVVIAEVAEHLASVDRRRLRDEAALAQAWREVRRCDDAVVPVLDPTSRADYLAVLRTGGPRPGRARSWLGLARVDVEVGRLHVGIHRRLLVLLGH